MTVPTTFRRIALALGMAICFAAAAQPADTPETRRAAAQELIQSVDSLMGPERMMGMMKNAMQAPMQQAFQNHPRLTAAQKQRAAQVMGDEMGAVMSTMMKEVMPGMYAAMIQMYTERFTLAEIQELHRFYASSVVRRATVLSAEELPRLMQPMMAAMAHWGPKLQERTKLAMEKLRAEGIEIEAPLPAAPAQKPGTKKTN